MAYLGKFDRGGKCECARLWVMFPCAHWWSISPYSSNIIFHGALAILGCPEAKNSDYLYVYYYSSINFLSPFWVPPPLRDVRHFFSGNPLGRHWKWSDPTWITLSCRLGWPPHLDTLEKQNKENSLPISGELSVRSISPSRLIDFGVKKYLEVASGSC